MRHTMASRHPGFCCLEFVQMPRQGVFLIFDKDAKVDAPRDAANLKNYWALSYWPLNDYVIFLNNFEKIRRYPAQIYDINFYGKVGFAERFAKLAKQRKWQRLCPPHCQVEVGKLFCGTCDSRTKGPYLAERNMFLQDRCRHLKQFGP